MVSFGSIFTIDEAGGKVLGSERLSRSSINNRAVTRSPNLRLDARERTPRNRFDLAVEFDMALLVGLHRGRDLGRGQAAVTKEAVS
jgi:hypothetical protein